jgi:hypothetical protein
VHFGAACSFFVYLSFCGLNFAADFYTEHERASDLSAQANPGKKILPSKKFHRQQSHKPNHCKSAIDLFCIARPAKARTLGRLR